MRPKTLAALGSVLLLGLLFRLINLGFGLPAMYDPDEPFFVLQGFKLLKDQTLNPGWFGHPGSTTIYLLALIDIGVAASGLLMGRYADLPTFAAAVYADPGLIFLPSRLAMALIGVGVIWLTFLIARRLFDTSTGIAAAAFVAINSLHIAWSQVIRTDIHCSLFMLAALLFAIRGGQSAKSREFILAGFFAGIAAATKWPGASILVAVAGAAFHLWRHDTPLKLLVRAVVLSGAAALAGLFMASPYILLDWRRVLANVSGEVASGHLGHSGHGLAWNLWWYLDTQLAGSMGWVAAVFSLAGLALLFARPLARATLLPATLIFLVMISAQEQIWARWLTPVLPLLSITAAFAVIGFGRKFAQFMPGRLNQATSIGLPLLVLLPSLWGAVSGARERANDTRDQASAWARAHIPAGSTVVVEHLALDLRPQPWSILFPIGANGCVDGRGALKGTVRYEDVQKARQGSAIIDLGNVPAAVLDSCRGDYLILTYFDLYTTEAAAFRRQIATYRALIGDGRTVALFRPIPGRSQGPVTRIVALGSHDRLNAALHQK